MGKRWHSELFSVDAEPGSFGLLAYSCCCRCLAAGDVAKAAGNNYLISCVVAALNCGCYHMALDRFALIEKLGIEDHTTRTGTFCMACFAGPCMLHQELNAIRAAAGPDAVVTESPAMR